MHLDAAVIEKDAQPGPVLGDVFKGFACWRFGRDLHTGMKLLHAAEDQGTQLVDDHRNQAMMLVARLETEETLELDAVKACLEPSEKARPFETKRKDSNSTTPEQPK